MAVHPPSRPRGLLDLEALAGRLADHLARTPTPLPDGNPGFTDLRDLSPGP